MSSPAVEYIQSGFVLVPIPSGRKGPTIEGWNTRPLCIATVEQARQLNGGNIGLAHAYSGTCAIDIDQYQAAEQWLAERGINLEALLMDDQSVQVSSGRDDRAKLLYRLPVGVGPLPERKVKSPSDPTEDMIDFRCATADGLTVQDVLPPSIHPDTGKPYVWIGDYRNLPVLPDGLLRVWRELIGNTPTAAPVGLNAVTPQVGVSVALETLGLSSWTIKLIREGNAEGKYPSRSEAIYGALKDLIKARLDDPIIYAVMTDPVNAISEKPLEQSRGDIQRAMKWIGNQIPKARAEVTAETAALFQSIPTFVQELAKPVGEVLDQLKSLSATNRLDEMETNLKNDYYIFREMALAGLMTLFYAWPNTGKTLLFLYFIIEAIRDERVKGEDVFYINADDNYKGLYTKAKIAQENGFQMISPQEAGVSPQDVLNLLVALAQSDGVNGKVVIMDTLKKFTDMMDKRAQAALYETLRGLVTKGATVIIAGHANKHPDADGNLVYEGTGDTMNDIDCAYSMYRMSEKSDEVQTVLFRREKDRGDIIPKVSYQYEKRQGMHYRDIIDSITRLDDSQASRASREKTEREIQDQYESELLFVKGLLADGPKNQTEILKAKEKSKDPLAGEVSTRGLRAALNRLTGIVWEVKRDVNNAKVYSLIGAETEAYRKASRG